MCSHRSWVSNSVLCTLVPSPLKLERSFGKASSSLLSLTAGLRPFPIPSTPPTSASLPLFQCTPPQSSPPRLPAPPGGSVKPPTALRHPQSSSPFAFASKTYTQRFKEASVLLGSVPAPRAWTLAVPISGAHVCKVVWPQAGSWDWKALGKFSVPALKTTVLLSPPCRSLGGSSGRAGSSPPPI